MLMERLKLKYCLPHKRLPGPVPTLAHLLPSRPFVDTRLHPVIPLHSFIGECTFDHFVCRILLSWAVIIIFNDFGCEAQVCC